MKRILLILPLFLVCQLRAQDLPYSSGSTGADGALTIDIVTGFSNRRQPAAAYDVARGVVVIQGGGYFSNYPTGNTFSLRFDTWTWDGATKTWVQKATSGPLGKRFIDMAYHVGTQKVLHYGGTTGGAGGDNTSTWDGTSWTTVSSSSAPGNRHNYSMAHDATPAVDEVIMFGGFESGPNMLHNSTWAWDGGTWTQKSPANPPPARGAHRMVWDDTRQEIVMFGGANTVYLNDTWVWKNGEWTEKSPVNSPPARIGFAMGYDPVSGKVIVHGGATGDAEGAPRFGDTWAWDGADWTEISTTAALTARTDHTMVTDTGKNELLLLGGVDAEFGEQDDTWRWDSTANGGDGDWVQVAGSTYVIDMNEKPDGVWNYTSINIPTGVRVDFVPNSNNTPVTWLATDSVLINGTVSVDGRHGFQNNNVPAGRAAGGPAGHAGGLGGTRIEVFDSITGTPGLGPGGGVPGITNAQAGEDGEFEGAYGNAYILPPQGGSGGGGAAANSTLDGGNGGGAAGAILIASSRDIQLNGTISANGGYGGRNTRFNGQFGGHGSGGAVKLVCDRLDGLGSIEAMGGGGTVANNTGGYIRIESFLRPFDISGTATAGNYSKSAPIQGLNLGAPPSLVVTSVSGENVAEPPTGGFGSPDVIFNEAGSVTIVVTATNIADGTPVTLRIVTNSSVIPLPAANDPDVLLNAGTATFTATVPAGFGTVQAFADYDITLP